MDSTTFVQNLPEGYMYSVKSVTGTEESYDAKVFASISSLEDVKNWIKKFSELTSTNWSVRRTFPGLKFNIRKDYVCHFNDYHNRVVSNHKKPSRYKNTGCPAKISIRIKQLTKSTCRYPWVRDGMPAIVMISFQHNHLIHSAQSLSFRRLHDSVRSQFYEYFESGMTPAAAGEYHSNSLELNPNIHNVVLARADASINPSAATIYGLYSKWRKSNMEKQFDEGMLDVLEQKLENYRAEGLTISVQRSPLCVAIMTPIMQRAHGLASAGDVIFVDSTSLCESGKQVITFMFIPSPCGAVPAGVAITAGQGKEDYLAAFSALKELMGSKGFNGRGYPVVFVTDDSVAEKWALKSVWPESHQMQCHFNIMQAVWRWLWTGEHGISNEDWQPLMQGFRKVLYSVEEEEAASNIVILMNSAVRYPHFQTYLTSLWERREEWCMAFCHIAALLGHHTNDFAEVTVRLFKDNVLTRCQAYNVATLVDFMVDVMEKFYASSLEKFANGRVTMYSLLIEKLLQQISSHITSKEQIHCARDTTGGYTMYYVPSQSTLGLSYGVDPILGVCSCKDGMSAKCCKHLVAVYKWFEGDLPTQPVVNPETRDRAVWLALGDEAQVVEFIKSLQEAPSGKEVAQPSIEDVLTTEVLNLWGSISRDVKTSLKHYSTTGHALQLKDSLMAFQENFGNIQNSSQLCTMFQCIGSTIPRVNNSPKVRVHVRPRLPRRPGVPRKRKPKVEKSHQLQAQAQMPTEVQVHVHAHTAHIQAQAELQHKQAVLEMAERQQAADLVNRQIPTDLINRQQLPAELVNRQHIPAELVLTRQMTPAELVSRQMTPADLVSRQMQVGLFGRPGPGGFLAPSF